MPLSATDLKQRRQQHAILQPYRSVLSNDLAKGRRRRVLLACRQG